MRLAIQKHDAGGPKRQSGRPGAWRVAVGHVSAAALLPHILMEFR